MRQFNACSINKNRKGMEFVNKLNDNCSSFNGIL